MPFSEKQITFMGVARIAGWQVKRYHVHSATDLIEPAVEAAAYRFLPELLPEPDGEAPPAGFTVLHRNRQGAFLDAYSWVWENVIECRTAAAGVEALGCPDDVPTRFRALDRPWIGCVWELAPFGHERSSWVRHVLQPDQPDLDSYLADAYPDGRCGGPG
ncbi:MAG TPA: hypothetical protein VG435_14420 [Acidimicrobiales bacterium]|jgi:hypothetical protein|nr:hypothetical protein [Acidimicrobiales bacterium]